jgi:hypothetical protein
MMKKPHLKDRLCTGQRSENCRNFLHNGASKNSSKLKRPIKTVSYISGLIFAEIPKTLHANKME